MHIPLLKIRFVFLWLLLYIPAQFLYAQDSLTYVPGVQVSPQLLEGTPIGAVMIQLHKNGRRYLADSAETDAFYRSFQIRPGTIFRQYMADLAIQRIQREKNIKEASYRLFNTEPAGPVFMLVDVYFLKPDELKSYDGKKGITQSKSLRSFPVLLETDHLKLMFILNGGVGIYNEVNAFHGKGPAFTQGNPVADNAAGRGVRFWGEGYLEPGVAGIWRIGKSGLYAYGSASLMITGRNSSDIYSDGPAAFADIERFYGGLLLTGLGKKKNIKMDLSAGRQFYQLNDGFLLSKFSGSANAGDRGSVYLNARTTFDHAAIFNLQWGKASFEAFYLEPQELFNNKQTNNNFTGGTLGYNDNKRWDLSLTHIRIPGGKATYSTPQGSIARKGMNIWNPKVWVKDIAGTGLFFRSEYAYQSHSRENMRSNAWYLAGGISKTNWKFRPVFTYRYAYMQGDDSTTARYERFDPILTGGLGNWVQGINSRKMIGSGNIISHRIEAKAYISKSFEFSVDYFYLQAQSLSNLGALAPISTLKSKPLAQEITLTTRYFINTHFLLLGVFSHSIPGSGFKQAFPDPIYPWTSAQIALFMFF